MSQFVTSKVAVLIPTCNAATTWAALSAAIRAQGLPPHQVFIIDSSSEDGTLELAQADGFQTLSIERCDFNHGGTRQLGAEQLAWAEIIIYLTQDSIPANSAAFSELLQAFRDPQVAAAYGRQLPRRGAGPIESHARLFNYPAASGQRAYADHQTLGIKTTFLSNSFAAYRRQALLSVGGFPAHVIMAEDALVAGRLLLAGWKTAYVASAQAYHSHDYTAREEFRRYFDIGVYHAREAWLRESFGNAGGEGLRFVKSEIRYLLPRHAYLIPYALLKTLAKAGGYYLGRREASLSRSWARRLSYHKGYWDTQLPSASLSYPKSAHGADRRTERDVETLSTPT
jgi:rhamnosyltransferase